LRVSVSIGLADSGNSNTVDAVKENARALKEACEKLKAEYPASEWVKRAQPYSLL
jgi:hypothetical protein